MMWLAKHRWFLLGLAFLALNGFAVVQLLRGRGAATVGVERASSEQVEAGTLDAVRWRFDAPMVPCERPVEFSPSVEGEFEWISPTELTFRPAAGWAACERFVATFSDELLATDARPLARGRETAFQTEPLKLLRVVQADYSSSGILLDVEFNAKVSPGQLRSHLRLETTDGRRIDFRTVGGGVPRESVRIASWTKPAGEVVARVRAGLSPVGGSLAMEDDVVVRAPVSPKLKLVHLNTRSQRFEAGHIEARFNLPLDLAVANELIAVEPEMKVSVDRHYGNTIEIHGDFKPGQKYTVIFREGLKSTLGAALKKELVRPVYFSDARPAARFSARGTYLSPEGGMTIPLKLVNSRKNKVVVKRIYPNNLVQLVARKERRYSGFWGTAHADISHVVGKMEFEVDARKNEVVEHTLDLRELLDGEIGAFHIAVRGQGSARDEHYMVVSDIGISVTQSAEECLVWANSLRTLAPAAGADVRILSLENQIVARGATDSNGVARVEFEEEGAKPFLVVVQQGADLSFLPLDGARVARPGATGGRAYLDKGHEAFLFTDRGVYRPGETMRLKAIVRDANAESPEPFPVKLIVYQPNGKTLCSADAMLSEVGTAAFDISWPDYEATGKHRVELRVPGGGKPIGQTIVAVEEFVPPGIRARIKIDSARAAAGDPLDFEVLAEHLFGRPAAELPVQARIDFIPAPFSPEAWKAFSFGDRRRRFQTIQKSLGKKKLNADGAATFSAVASTSWRPAAAIKAVVSGTVTETGGRGVTTYAGRTIDVYPHYLGLRRTNDTFEVVAVRPDGALAAEVGPLEFAVDRMVWASVLKRQGDRYRYHSERQALPVERRVIELASGRGEAAFEPDGAGQYRFSISDPASGAATSVEFYVGADGQTWSSRSMESPDVVELAFDKAAYEIGETATLTIKSPFAGRALLTLESDQLLRHQVISLTNNTVDISIPVTTNHAPNVYCSVSVIRAALPEEIWGQHRAAGRIALMVDRPERALAVELETPEEIRPQTRLRIPVRVTDSEGGGVAAEVAVAAVDEGVLMLSDFKTPDPHNWFFAPRLPVFTLIDLYARLMPETLEKVDGAPSAPGGGMLAAIRKRLNPIKTRRFKSVALWEANVPTDANGVAVVEFDVPEFTGELRVMAVAVDRARHGSADASVVVKRPLVVRTSLPRFLAPDDTFVLPARVWNESEEDATVDFEVAFATNQYTRGFVLAAGGATNLAFDLAAPSVPGKSVCRITATMGEERYEENVEMSVRPAAARVVFAGGGMLASGATTNLTIPNEWLETTGEAALHCSTLPTVKLRGSADYLLRYPYGCLEQTTSRTMPLLYLPELADIDDVTPLVDAGLQRVLAMQRRDGSFSYWPEGSVYAWGSIYATHFLVEAKAAGYDVPRGQLDGALDQLERFLERGAVDEAAEIYNRSYACFVLALAERPRHGETARLMGLDEKKLSRGARINCAAALMASGKRRDAVAYLEQIGAKPTANPLRELGGALRSNVVNDGLLLSVLLDVDRAHPLVPELVLRLDAAQTNGRWRNTRDNAVALMAMGKYCRAMKAEQRPMRARMNGRMVEKPTRMDLEGTSVALENLGEGPVYYHWKSEGVPADGNVEELDRGIVARRELFNINQSPADSANLRQGDLYVIKVSLTAKTMVDNIAVEDLLPAGLEIENVNLKTARSVRWIRGKQTLPTRNADLRDDRMLLFTGGFSNKCDYYYLVRAVTEGEFVWPALSAECMYDPEIRSVNGKGTVRVVVEN